MPNVEHFIRNGYIPYEMIPSISTGNLADNLHKVLPHLEELRKNKRNSKSCLYSIPKVKHLRRILSIPNPLHQIDLCNKLALGWEAINDYIDESTLSLSKPVETLYEPILGYIADGERTFNRRIQLSDIPRYRALFSTDTRYLLKADLSRFYPTIYTHTIPWALHTKETAKAKRRDRSLIGNIIDEAVRNTQHEQTMGIPIGPDSSLVISEIVGTAIDKQVCSSLKAKKIEPKGFRFVDDYYLYFSTLAQAEYALSALNLAIKEYELELNVEKTKIISLPTSLEAAWILELKKLDIDNYNGEPYQSDQLIAYFSNAFELTNKYPDESVLKYALSEISDVYVSELDWDLYESLILKCMIAEPSVLPTALEIFLAYKSMSYKINLKRIANTLFEIIAYHSDYSHSHELAWALWFCKTFKIKINKSISKKIEGIKDSFVALVALDLHNAGLMKYIDKEKWKPILRVEELYSENWLFAYEAIKKGWLFPEDGVNYLASDTFFKILWENDVEFYNPTKQVKAALVSKTKKVPNVIVKERIRRKRRSRVY